MGHLVVCTYKWGKHPRGESFLVQLQRYLFCPEEVAREAVVSELLKA